MMTEKILQEHREELDSLREAQVRHEDIFCINNNEKSKWFCHLKLCLTNDFVLQVNLQSQIHRLRKRVADLKSQTSKSDSITPNDRYVYTKNA